jgi:branched-chain amino acid transport system ATP-binding protein
VSFDLQQGELLALIGPNGAGKTTCFNMLNGQLKADSGEVKLNGESILGLSPAGSGARAWAAPSRSPRPSASMTVRENVQMALISHHKQTWNLWSRGI